MIFFVGLTCDCEILEDRDYILIDLSQHLVSLIQSGDVKNIFELKY